MAYNARMRTAHIIGQFDSEYTFANFPKLELAASRLRFHHPRLLRLYRRAQKKHPVRSGCFQTTKNGEELIP